MLCGDDRSADDCVDDRSADDCGDDRSADDCGDDRSADDCGDDRSADVCIFTATTACNAIPSCVQNCVENFLAASSNAACLSASPTCAEYSALYRNKNAIRKCKNKANFGQLVQTCCGESRVVVCTSAAGLNKAVLLLSNHQ